MYRTKRFAVLLSVILMCLLFVPIPAALAFDAEFTGAAVPQEENGVLTLADGQTWLKVKGFENDTEYILTVRNGAGEPRMLTVSDGGYSRYVWRYTKYTMTPSTDPLVTALSSGEYTLVYTESGLRPFFASYPGGDMIWTHEDSALCYRGSGVTAYLKYDEDHEPHFGFTEDRSAASEVRVYARGSRLARCITGQPAAQSYVIEGSGYPAPVFSVGLADGVTADRVQWFVDGAEQPCTAQEFTAELLTDRTAGVHRVSCTVTAHDCDGVHYHEDSAEASFVIAKGVVPDSVMTFSDIHEEYHLIPRAIERIQLETDGYIPSLVICSGDFVNGPTAERDQELNNYFPRMKSALGGLDAVFVSGNHDSAEAAAMLSADAALGAEQPLPASGGQIFDGCSAAVSQNGKNSRFARGILAYGINFAAAVQETDDGVRYSYESVTADVRHFLESAAAQYHGQLVVISAHSGLHALGVQPESMYGTQARLMEWVGENMYNVDQGYELAELLNRYAEQYDMDILYLFGHNHSRGEKEIFLTAGDTLFSPVHYSERHAEAQTLQFTYANAGYLSTVIGSADANFSFIRRDGDQFRYQLLRVWEGTVRDTAFRVRHPYEELPPAETTAQTASSGTTETAAAQTTASVPEQIPAPAAGRQLPEVSAAMFAFAVLLFSRKRRRVSR